MTKRVFVTLVLAMVAVGCALLRDRVPLLAGDYDGMASSGACFASMSVRGPLVVDPTYGTAVMDGVVIEGATSAHVVPVAWRPGFTARRSGPEVEVLDPQGNVVAVTGRRYVIPGGYVTPGSGFPAQPAPPAQVFWACDSVTPVP